MTARSEILASVRRVTAGRPDGIFSPADIVSDLETYGTALKESTIRTHVVSRLCLNAPRNHAHRWPDFLRLGRGEYRLATDEEKRAWVD